MKALVAPDTVLIINTRAKSQVKGPYKPFQHWDEILTVDGIAPGTFTWAITWTLKSGQAYRYSGADMDLATAARIRNILIYPLGGVQQAQLGGEFYNPFPRLTCLRKEAV